MTRRSRSTTRRDEQGAVLVMTALCIVLLLVIVAIVIDLGATRGERRNAQLAVDNATSTAGLTLGDEGAVAACETALDYLELNLDSGPLTGGDCDTFDFILSACSDATSRADTWTSADGTFTVTIEHPVPDDSDLMASSSTIGANGLAIDAAADGTGCERIGIDIVTTGDAYFGNIVGDDERTSRIHAVALSTQPDPDELVVPAFLMLDRTACQSIFTNTGTNSTGLTYPDGTQRPDGILVHHNGQQPGVVHTDSDGSDCGNGTSDKAIWAAKPSSLNTIFVEALDADNPGVASAVAPDGKRAGGGINVPATQGQVVSRTPVDDIYQSAITYFHSQAYAAVTAAGQPANSNRYDCDGQPVGPQNATFTTAYIDCSFPPSEKPDFTLTGPTTVVFSEGVSLGNASRISLPTATTVNVRGGLSVSGGGGDNWAAFQAPAVRNMHVGGRIVITSNAILNLGAAPVSSNTMPTCTSTSPTARLAAFSPNGNADPALDISGRAALCAATVYLAGPRTFPDGTANNSYTELSLESGPPDCSPTQPCPWVTGNPSPGARFALTGEVTWRAPSATSAPLTPDIALPTSGGVEDLALWAEGAEKSEVKSGATLRTAGVYFTPNSVVELRSGNADTNPVDAQFIARQVKVFAGLFTMRPTLTNSVPVPLPRINNLIR